MSSPLSVSLSVDVSDVPLELLSATELALPGPKVYRTGEEMAGIVSLPAYWVLPRAERSRISLKVLRSEGMAGMRSRNTAGKRWEIMDGFLDSGSSRKEVLESPVGAAPNIILHAGQNCWGLLSDAGRKRNEGSQKHTEPLCSRRISDDS